MLPSGQVRTDAQLLDAWRAGDANAGRELFERHISCVSRFFRNKVGQEREDLIQRTFLACVEARDRIRDGASFRHYVLRVARSKLYNHIAARPGSVHRPDPMTQSIADFGGSPSLVIAKSQQDQLLLHSLRTLPLDLQMMLELHYWEGMSTQDLALVFEIPQGTVKTRMWRARQMLRERLEHFSQAGQLPESSLDDLDAWAGSLKADVTQETPIG
jgi:RNA polymerase sigma-70 factor (ECF subfamily)